MIENSKPRKDERRIYFSIL